MEHPLDPADHSVDPEEQRLDPARQRVDPADQSVYPTARKVDLPEQRADPAPFAPHPAHTQPRTAVGGTLRLLPKRTVAASRVGPDSCRSLYNLGPGSGAGRPTTMSVSARKPRRTLDLRDLKACGNPR